MGVNVRVKVGQGREVEVGVRVGVGVEVRVGVNVKVGVNVRVGACAVKVNGTSVEANSGLNRKGVLTGSAARSLT